MAKKKKYIVYSTNPDFNFVDEEEAQETLQPNDQNLYVSIDRKQRGGKEVTLVEGFAGNPDDLKDLAKFLKGKCGVGGSVKDGNILIQGKHKEKVFDLLISQRYKVKKKGGN